MIAAILTSHWSRGTAMTWRGSRTVVSNGSVMAAAVLSLLSTSPAMAQMSAPSPRPLVDMCWSPTALQARLGEERAVRRAPGYNASIPRHSLASFDVVPHGLRGAIRRVALPPTAGKLVALTFDLCEAPGEVAGYDGAIIDYLRANDIRATLFAGGKWMVNHGERARQLMADPRFEIANHGWSHQNLRLLDTAGRIREIQGPQIAYEWTRAELMRAQCVAGGPTGPAPVSAVAPRIGLFRFPYGACNAEALDAVAANGLLAIQWDVSTGDPSPQQSAQAIAREMVGRARPGSIIIAHANGRGYHTAEALRIAIPQLKAKGYRFVTVSELLRAGKPVIEQRCYDARPGDTDRYDVLAARPVQPKERAHVAPGAIPR
jgi:peptidoglycan/xylan/chitin deacetylase (PgdA/CDA1 family)